MTCPSKKYDLDSAYVCIAETAKLRVCLATFTVRTYSNREGKDCILLKLSKLFS